MARQKETEGEWYRKKDESEQAYEAFKVYYKMGTERSCVKVARTLGKSDTLITGWCSRWNWVERSRAYDNALEKEAFKSACDEIRKMNQQQAQIGLLVQKKAIEALKELKAKELYPKLLLQYLVEGARLERRARASSMESCTADIKRNV